jgi:hypothetical protein
MRYPRSRRRLRVAAEPNSITIPITIAIALFALAGCVTRQTEVSGLRPLFPPAEHRTNVFAGPQPDQGCRFTVGSLRPEIRWSPFLLPAEEGAAASSGPVTYELRIWESANGSPSTLVYARAGLVEASHTLEKALRPGTPYFWSVRARFAQGGEPRVSDWSQRLVGLVLVREQTGNPGALREILHRYYEPHCFRTPGDGAGDGE